LVYTVGDAFVIADAAGWLPGSYASRDTAVHALAVPYGTLFELQERINKGEQRSIAMDDLPSDDR
jgi:hypothetical protein